MLSKLSFFGEQLRCWAEKTPDKDAISDFFESLTYEQLYRKSSRIAGFFHNQGLEKGERVIVALGNTVSQICYHYGACLCGGVVVPLPDSLTAQMLPFYIEDTGARFLVTRNGVQNRNLEKVSELEEFERCREFCASRSDDDLLAIMYTTGSTGKPKGVALMQKTLFAALERVVDCLSYDGTQREMVVLPVSHSFGLGHVYCNHLTGGYVHLEKGLLKPKRVFSAFDIRKINGMPATPSICELFLGRFREAFLRYKDSLEFMVVNSAPLPPRLTKLILGHMPNLKLFVYYGLTEASRSTFITLSDEPPENWGSVGKPRSPVEIKLVDGEICIRGPHLFHEYWNRPEETMEAVKNGWFHTGDLGELDSNGYLTVTGRLKDQINVGGLKVSPVEVERVVSLLPWVRDVAVAGLDDRIKGQAVGVLIVPEGPPDESEEELGITLRNHCAKYLEPHMLPEVVKLSASIPKSETGKILREEVKSCLS